MASEKVTYAGKEADVTWDGALCIHIGECGRADNAVFQGGRDPWCQPDTEGVDAVLDVVQRCPAGALSVQRHDGGPAEAPTPENTVTVSAHGPLYVRGDLAIEGAVAPGVKFRAALCRCGQSKNKPYCDNAHEGSGFRDSGAVGRTSAEVESAGGTLTVRGIEDGPLMVTGSFCIRAASGRRAWAGDKAALCRCGASNNKPFCDGSHKAAGFTSG